VTWIGPTRPPAQVARWPGDPANPTTTIFINDFEGLIAQVGGLSTRVATARQVQRKGM
jgi:hypothetical protein